MIVASINHFQYCDETWSPPESIKGCTGSWSETMTFLVPNCQFYVWRTQATKLIYVQYRNITVDQNTPLNCACFQRWSVTTHSLFKRWDWILPVRTSITDKMSWLNLQRCRDKAKHFHKKYPLAVYWKMTEKFWVIFIFYFLNFILCILPTKLYLTQRATYLSQEYCEEKKVINIC